MAVSQKITGRSILRGLWKCIRGIASFVTSLIILAAILLVILYIMKIRPYVATSGSMEPAIPVNSICFVNERTEFPDIQPGDVITFRMGEDMLVTHRVIEVRAGSLITRGDANNTEDAAPVTATNYIGKTVIILPKLGRILILLRTPVGIITAVALILTLLVISFLPVKKTKEKKTEKQDTAEMSEEMENTKMSEEINQSETPEKMNQTEVSMEINQTELPNEITNRTEESSIKNAKGKDTPS